MTASGDATARNASERPAVTRSGNILCNSVQLAVKGGAGPAVTVVGADSTQVTREKELYDGCAEIRR